jgi:hypothetical protein
MVWDRYDRDLGGLLGRCQRKGIPVRVVVSGCPDEPTGEGAEPDAGAGRDGRRGGLPD